MTKPSTVPKPIKHPPALNLTDGLREIAREVCHAIPELAHIQLDAVQFTIFHSRTAERTLTFARCYPLSTQIKKQAKRQYQLTPIIMQDGIQARYILSFAWPRFWQMTPTQRLETLVHELYHIAPEFDGNARTFDVGGWHGKGRAWFDTIIHQLVQTHFPQGIHHPVLHLKPEDQPRVTAERLQKPYWKQIIRNT